MTSPETKTRIELGGGYKLEAPPMADRLDIISPEGESVGCFWVPELALAFAAALQQAQQPTPPVAQVAAWDEALENDDLLAEANAWYSETQVDEIKRHARHDRDCLSRKGANYGEECCDCRLNDALRARPITRAILLARLSETRGAQVAAREERGILLTRAEVAEDFLEQIAEAIGMGDRETNAELVDQIAGIIRVLGSGPSETRADRGAEWQDISTAPKDGTRILAWTHVAETLAWDGRSNALDVKGWRDTHGTYRKPTLWMPLPARPTTHPQAAPSAAPSRGEMGE